MICSCRIFSTHAFDRFCPCICNTRLDLKIELDFGFELHTFQHRSYALLECVFFHVGFARNSWNFHCSCYTCNVKSHQQQNVNPLWHNFMLYFSKPVAYKMPYFCIESLIFVHYKYHLFFSRAYLYCYTKWTYQTFIVVLYHERCMNANMCTFHARFWSKWPVSDFAWWF